MNLYGLSQEAYRTACNLGWHDSFQVPGRYFLTLMLMELGEAAKAWIQCRRFEQEDYELSVFLCGGFDALTEDSDGLVSKECYDQHIRGTVEEKLADATIRMLDFCVLSGISLKKDIPTAPQRFPQSKKTLAECVFLVSRHLTSTLPNGKGERDGRVRLALSALITWCQSEGIDLIWHVRKKLAYLNSFTLAGGVNRNLI